MEKQDWLKELANFLVEANRNTWAANNGAVVPERKDFKEFEYKKGFWVLRDSYSGYFKAPGTTIVRFKDSPAWYMSYGGDGMLEGKESQVEDTFTFLRSALMNVTPEMPFRGPNTYSEDNWFYSFSLDQHDRDITNFLGREKIILNGETGSETVFRQTVMGGIFVGENSRGGIVYPWEL